MAIPGAQLKLKYGNVDLTHRGDSRHMALDWQTYHATLLDTVASGTLSATVYSLSNIENEYAALVAQATSRHGNIVDLHAPRASIGGYSLWDADLILDGWMQTPTDLVHPLSGTIAGGPSALPNTVNRILAACLPPPVWFWAESVTGGVRVKCVAVTGATVYYVYNGTTLLGNVPNAGWNTLALPDGSYNVRMAGVKAGVVGVCSFPIPVRVGVVTPPGAMAVVTTSKPAGRLRRFLRDPFKVLPDA